MQLNRTFLSLTKSLFCAALLVGAAAQAADKTDPSGTWTWSQPGRNGGPDRTNTLTFKMEGSKLTGKLTSPGRGGGAPSETEISDAKVDGNTLTFSTVREFNGNSATNKYSGKIEGGKITGKMEFNRNGEAQSRDWEAKKVEDKK